MPATLTLNVLTFPTFEFEHRICPGLHFAGSSLFLTLSSVLHTLSVTPPLDAAGKPQRPKIKMTTGVISYVSSLHSLGITRFRLLTSITATRSISNVSSGLVRPGQRHSFTPTTSLRDEVTFIES